ncbi:LacI family DNA-binding transcriptional regulator [Peribacillus sp. B-H-3]|uniref:LacI family DNA-binding transcriptional regulator n=1 Tax=Peribacillus sp. B-H-3 TaxID=3400420 RepID=UPI003B0152C4
MTTIADVASLAGLSNATVSRVINNHPNVTEEKKQKVREAMEALNYYPNSSAQRLRNQKTDTIAILIPILTNPFFAYLLEAIDTVATQNNLQLLVCQTRYDKKKELKFLQLLKTKQVDGLILTSIENDWEVIEEYTSCGPMVLCNEYDKRANIPTVRLNQLEAGYLGTKHLLKMGHKKIAITSGGKSSLARDRDRGIQMALNEYGIHVRQEWRVSNVFNMEDGCRVFHYLQNLPDKPTAVFTGSDQVATGMLVEAKKSGISIPKDFAVMGFDDQPISRAMDPELTTIKQPVEEMGRIAMEKIIDAINGKKDYAVQHTLLPFELVVRGSTK